MDLSDGGLVFPRARDKREEKWRTKDENNASLETLDSEEDVRLSPQLRERYLRKPAPPSEPHPHPHPSSSPPILTGRRKKKKKHRKWPPPILALEFQRTSPADTMAWLVLRMQDPLEDGGIEAYVRIVPPLKDLGTTLLLSCSTELAMKVALVHRSSVWQPKFSAPFRDECDSCKSSTVDSGLVTSEKQRLFFHAVHQMPTLEMEASAGIPGREQLDLMTGEPIMPYLVETGIASRLYPLHEPEKLAILTNMSWSFGFFDDDTWDGVREYFGIPIAIHFLFRSMVTRAILGMSVTGFAALGLSWIWNNPRGHLGIVAVGNIIVAALFPKLWRQRCCDLSAKWGMPRWDEPAPKINRRLRPHYGSPYFNAVTSEWEQQYPRWKRMVWAAALTVPSLFFIMLMSMMMQLNYLNLQENHRWWEKNESSVNSHTNTTTNDSLGNAKSAVNRTSSVEKGYYAINIPVMLSELLIEGQPWGHWLGFRIMTILYAAFVVVIGYVVKCVVNVTTVWGNVIIALFAVNFLPLYTTYVTQKSLHRINELMLYVMGLDFLVSVTKRYFVCTWVSSCVSIFREERGSSTNQMQESTCNFTAGLRHSLSGRSPRSAVERRHRSLSSTPSESSSSTSSSQHSVTPKAGESHTCRPPSPPPSVPAIHKCLPPPADDIPPPVTRAPQGNVGQWVTTVGRAEQRAWKSKPDPALLPFEGWFDDHDEVLMHFSRAFLFPVLYLPLACLAVVGSMVMLDADGRVLCYALQRPVVTIERGLGQSWQVALEVISWIILLSNSAILYFSFAERGKGIQQVSWFLTLAVAVGMAICIKLIVICMLPDCPVPPPSPVRPANPSAAKERLPCITCRRRPFPVERN